MEDGRKILKVEYLSNQLLDSTQILNLILDDQSKLYKPFKLRRPPIEDNLKILKVEYLSNQLLDPSPILKLSFKIVYKSFFNEDNLQWKTTSKY